MMCPSGIAGVADLEAFRFYDAEVQPDADGTDQTFLAVLDPESRAELQGRVPSSV
jgi:hypothetical protein